MVSSYRVKSVMEITSVALTVHADANAPSKPEGIAAFEKREVQIA
jgi:hypothetical protein